MDEIEDYFADLPAGAGDEGGEEDAANDLTFGDEETADIVPGDKLGTAWKSGHEELAARIEREKEEILQQAPKPSSVPVAGQADVDGPSALSYQEALHAQMFRQQQQHQQGQLQHREMMQQQQQQPVQLESAAVQDSQKGVNSHGALHAPSQRPPDGVPAMRPGAPPQQLQPGQMQAVYIHMQRMHQAQQQDHQRYGMIQSAYAEHMRRFTLQNQQYAQHNNGAHPPVEIREQQQHAIQAIQQQMQQLHQQMHSRQAAIVQLHAQIRHAQMQHQQQQHSQAQQPLQQAVPPQLQQQAEMAQAHDRAPPMTANGTFVGPPVPAASGDVVEKPVVPGGRMAEIERQMAAAGLGPAGGGPKTMATVEDIERQMIAGTQSQKSDLQAQQRKGAGSSGAKNRRGYQTGANAPRRGLENMTEKDLEIVLKMHLRQLEISDTYKDEYYWFVLREKKASGDADTFERLAGIVAATGAHSGRGMNGKRSGPKGARPRSAAEDDGGDVDAAKSHTPENMSTLATALGTLQVWNPKAPRKLVDFGTGTDPREPAAGTDTAASVPSPVAEKLLREDGRIVVRAAVENGYDILASIHDVARRKVQGNVKQLVTALFDLFRLPLESSQSEQAEGDSFVVRMCGFSKGKLFVSRALAVLRPLQQSALCCCIARNLHLLSLLAPVSHVEDASTRKFWSAVSGHVHPAGGDPLVAVDMLREFDRTHKVNAKHVVSALRFASGAGLVASCLQSVLSASKAGAVDKDVAAANSSVTGKVCDTIVHSLGDIFEACEDSGSVWQVAALLDAVAPPDCQGRLRGMLKSLLDDGRAPNPPQA